MSAKDIFHEVVKLALQKEQWLITDDPLRFKFGNVNFQMDKITQYREHIQKLLTHYAKDDVSDDEVEVQLIFDIERDHYQWMNVGWQQFNRIYRCIIHFDIKEGKIWLQQNLTDQNPAEELVAMGVPKEDIILGLQPPYKRQYTEYGVA